MPLNLVPLIDPIIATNKIKNCSIDKKLYTLSAEKNVGAHVVYVLIYQMNFAYLFYCSFVYALL